MTLRSCMSLCMIGSKIGENQTVSPYNHAIISCVELFGDFT